MPVGHVYVDRPRGGRWCAAGPVGATSHWQCGDTSRRADVRLASTATKITALIEHCTVMHVYAMTHSTAPSSEPLTYCAELAASSPATASECYAVVLRSGSVCWGRNQRHKAN
jgi:hypothetical protein